MSMDKSSIGGLCVALGGILLGLLLEGGKVAQILQPTAAVIVLGGTIGAVMLHFPARLIVTACRDLLHVFVDVRRDFHALIRELVDYAIKARREGIISLDSGLNEVSDPFLHKCLMLAIDGTEPHELRKTMELEMNNQASYEEQIPQVLEAAGGFAPTVGIIGAVLGLIQVMQHLENIDEVGRGIAVAFVATVYGVGIANLFCLPAAGKLRIYFRREHSARELVLEGVISILEGMNPRMLETKLRTFMPEAEIRPQAGG
jgi:chemotaxis protein MotA